MNRFTKNEDGTVYDSLLDVTWSQTIAVDVDDKGEAQAAIEKLGPEWRMPTAQELFSLVDHTRHGPAIDTDVFPNTKSDFYWTSTPCAWNPESARWVVGFYDGLVGGYLRSLSGACVRACRAGQ